MNMNRFDVKKKKNIRRRGMDLFGSRSGQVTGFCEHGGDKHPGSIKI